MKQRLQKCAESMADRPRADDLERMYATFPALHRLNWSAPDVSSGLDLQLWRLYHALHCKHGCGPMRISDTCYFRILEFFLRTGLQPPFDDGEWEPRSSTYIRGPFSEAQRWMPAGFLEMARQ